jgi:hypothetical protein
MHSLEQQEILGRIEALKNDNSVLIQLGVRVEGKAFDIKVR